MCRWCNTRHTKISASIYQSIINLGVENEQKGSFPELDGAALSVSSAVVVEDKILTNSFGLVYSGAIVENVKDEVNIHPVTYELNGIDISADVYTPADLDPDKKYPAVVVARPNGGVKEQAAGLYARRLAEFDRRRHPYQNLPETAIREPGVEQASRVLRRGALTRGFIDSID